MRSETEIIIAFIFKRSGKTELTSSEFYLPISMDLKWFSPQEAKAFVDMVINQNLLVKKGDLLKPNFNIDSVVIPAGFKPSKQDFNKNEFVTQKQEKQDIVEIIVGKIIKKTDLARQTIFEKIKLIEKEKNITLKVAALLVGKEYNIDLNGFLK
ncbi:MAG: hypothetical protein DRP08_06900 [Candidatus Aenigmatarchaeota archaeon]|nr:MAG: hypothetical protein DRP08_06900 [Candidatus Aenigmarchaeota archaeon]